MKKEGVCSEVKILCADRLTGKFSLKRFFQKGKFGVVQCLENISRGNGLFACSNGVFIGAAMRDRG